MSDAQLMLVESGAQLMLRATVEERWCGVIYYYCRCKGQWWCNAQVMLNVLLSMTRVHDAACAIVGRERRTTDGPCTRVMVCGVE